MPFDTPHENSILKVLFGQQQSWSVGSDIYLALTSNDPRADKGSISELSGDTYERVLIAKYGTDLLNHMNVPNDGKISNKIQINWNKATTAWGTAKGFAMYNAKTNGSLIFYDKLKEDVEIAPNSVALFDPGDFSISFTDPDEAAASVSTM